MPALTPPDSARARPASGTSAAVIQHQQLNLIGASRAYCSITPGAYGNSLRIMQTPNEVIISYEMIHDTRVIPLDGRPHVGSNIKRWAIRAALGRHARRRDDELHRPRWRDDSPNSDAEGDQASRASIDMITTAFASTIR